MLSGSWAHCAKALQVFINNWLFVPVSKLTNGEMPPDFRIEARLSGSCEHSAKAPTVFISTSSVGSVNKLTKDSIVFSSWNLFTFSLVIEHFHMAPVAAASKCLFSLLLSSLTRGSRPPNFRIKSLVSLSSAHLNIAFAQCISSSSFDFFRLLTKFSIMPSVLMANL